MQKTAWKSLILTLLLVLLQPALTLSQTLMNRDSLLRLLPRAKEDTNKVLLLINIGQQYESNEPETAKKYYLQSRKLSQKLGYTLGEIKFVSNYGYVLNMQGYFDSTLALNLHAVKLASQLNDPITLGKALFNTGSSYKLKEEYEKATEYYLKAYPVLEKSGNTTMIATALDILQNLYINTQQYDKAVASGEKAVKLSRELNDSIRLGTSLSNLGNSYTNVERYKEALAAYTEAMAIGTRIGDLNMQSTVHLNTADFHYKIKQFESYKKHIERALELARQLQLYQNEVIALKGLSFYYYQKKDYLRSQDFALQALAIADKFGFREQRAKIYEVLSKLGYSMQNQAMGEKYEDKAIRLSDSLINESIRKNTLELQTRYETEKKDNQIQLQQARIKGQQTINLLLISGIIALGLIALLVYRNYIHRQRLQQQRIAELETQQQLEATEAVLQGEEKERARLAKDLHDGLGGMLSGIKYSLNTMKGNLILTAENAQAFERSIDMLDSSIREMRRVAHNMMPEVLVRFGLDAALHDFCTEITQSGALRINYQSIGTENLEIDQSTAISIYRIVQELLHNVIKHAAAKDALVQLSNDAGEISVTVEDDGKGFDTGILKTAKGMGWDSIKNRVELLKGTVDIQSEDGKGTSVYIQIRKT